MTEPVLAIDALSVEFVTRSGPVRVLRDLSFRVQPGETVALVGESGCGKSMTALAVMGLLPRPNGRIASGSIRLEGRELVGGDPDRLAEMRGDRVAMIFQEPMTALNPVFTIGDQIAEVLRIHRNLPYRDAMRRAQEALAVVDIPDPARRLKQYPHELSGGMRQRVMIAMAVACEPRLLIADEPTTALDVTVQAPDLRPLEGPQEAHRNGADPDHPRHGGSRRTRGQCGRDVCRARRRNRSVDDLLHVPLQSLHARPDRLYSRY